MLQIYIWTKKKPCEEIRMHNLCFIVTEDFNKYVKGC